MRADRLLSLLLLLQSRGKTTARELAGRLEVSVRTVYRDLDALSAAGVPVIATGGPGGGCELVAGYRSPLLGISAEEATALLAVSSSGPLERIALGDALAQARLKLLAALPAANRADTMTAASRFHLDSAAWFKPPELVPCLAALVEAVRQDRRLRLTYSRPGRSPGIEVVDPLGLVAKAGVWYLAVGGPGGRLRAHRASRITRAELLDETFTRPPDFDLAGFWGDWAAKFEASLGKLEVLVKLSPAGLAALPEILGTTSPPTTKPAEAPAGWRTVTLNFDSLKAARRRLLSFGPEAEVVQPSSLRTDLAACARLTAAVYDAGRSFG